MARLLLGPTFDIYLTIDETAELLSKSPEEIEKTFDLYQLNGKGEYYVCMSQTFKDLNSPKAKYLMDLFSSAIGDIQTIVETLQLISRDLVELLKKEHFEIAEKSLPQRRRGRSRKQ